MKRYQGYKEFAIHNIMEEKDSRPLMVTIRCITYNHEPYIRQCLEGFVMQKTNFRFEAVVHDDASTDGTADIIREYAEKYPDIIKPIFETENQYSKHDGAISRIMNEHTHGKYVAMCEGDDYWIDSLKLQKQVDFLEGNPEYSMCFHNAFVYKEEIPDVSLFNMMKSDKDLLPHDAIHKWLVPTAAIVAHRNVVLNHPQWMPRIYSGDYSLILFALYCGKIHYLHSISSVYRLSYSAGSMSALMKKQGIFVIEQHLLLLKAYNKGTNYIFKKELNSRIKVLEKELRFQKAMKNKDIYGLLLSADLIIKKSLNRLGIKKR